MNLVIFYPFTTPNALQLGAGRIIFTRPNQPGQRQHQNQTLDGGVREPICNLI